MSSTLLPENSIATPHYPVLISEIIQNIKPENNKIGMTIKWMIQVHSPAFADQKLTTESTS